MGSVKETLAENKELLKKIHECLGVLFQEVQSPKKRIDERIPPQTLEQLLVSGKAGLFFYLIFTLAN